MKRITFFTMTIMTAWLLQSCGGNTSNNKDSVDSAKDVNEATVNEVKAVDEKSTDFAVKAANGGMMEVELGKLAQERGVSQRVKDFGTMMVSDHTKVNDELKAIATTKNIALPGTLGEDMQKHVNDLSKKTGKDFDKAYMDMMTDDHEKDVSEFDKAAGNLEDPELKTFASNTLPTLRAHLDSAKAVKESLKK